MISQGKLLTVLAALVALAGCNAAEPAPGPQAVSSVEEALTNPLLDCRSEQADCLTSAASLADAQACDEAMRACLETATTEAQAAASDLQDCRDQAMACIKAGGAQAAAQCRSDFEACVGGVLPAPTSGSAGTFSLPGLPGSGGIGGSLPGLPGSGGGLPSLPGGGLAGSGGGLPSLPGSTPTSPAATCLSDLRTCIQAGTDPTTCATDARACLKTALNLP